jgi:hypothetical protein
VAIVVHSGCQVSGYHSGEAVRQVLGEPRGRRTAIAVLLAARGLDGILCSARPSRGSVHVLCVMHTRVCREGRYSGVGDRGATDQRGEDADDDTQENQGLHGGVFSAYGYAYQATSARRFLLPSTGTVRHLVPTPSPPTMMRLMVTRFCSPRTVPQHGHQPSRSPRSSRLMATGQL